MDELDRSLKDWARVRREDLRDPDPLIPEIRRGLERPAPDPFTFKAWHLVSGLALFWLVLMGGAWLVSFWEDAPSRTAPVTVQMTAPDTIGVWSQVVSPAAKEDPAVDLDAYSALIGDL